MNIFEIITTTLTIVISCCAIYFSIKYSKLQVKHNQNSVRPLSLIDIGNYEDELYVKIVNNGVGPLIVKKIVCKNSKKECNNLIDLLADITSNWTDYTKEVVGKSIAVGKSLVLVSISPKSDKIQRKIRETLSTIEIQIEYMDIYNNVFYDYRKLVFFE